MTYTTSHTLLQKLRSGGDELAWYRFCDFYKPLIAKRGMDFKLVGQEIDSLIQDVLLACHREKVLSNYDGERGRFRDYLRTVTSRNARRLLDARNASSQVSPPPEELEEVASENELTELWEEECQEFIQQKALEELRSTLDAKTYMAFEMHALNGMNANEVGKILDLSARQIYLIRSRCAGRLKEIVARLQREL